MSSRGVAGLVLATVVLALTAFAAWLALGGDAPAADPSAPAGLALPLGEDDAALTTTRPDLAPRRAEAVAPDAVDVARRTPLAVWTARLEPAAHVDVQVWDADGTPAGPPRRTDASGRVELTLPEAGSVTARDPGDLAVSRHVPVRDLREEPHSRDLVLAPPGVVEVALSPRDQAGEVWVRAATRDGRSGELPGLDVARRAPGARTADDPEPFTLPMRAARPGRFVLDVDADVQLRVHAVRGGRRGRDVTLTSEAGRRVAVTLAPPGRFAIAGHVVDAQGEPLPSATVSAWWAGNATAGDDWLARSDVRSDERGRFHVDLDRAGGWTVAASGPDGLPGATQRVELQDWRPDAELTLQLPRAARIGGRVVDGDGAPWPGVSVHARPAHLFDPEQELRAPSAWTRYGSARAATDADGRFVLEPLHPDGTYILFARPDPDDPERKLVLRDVPAGSEDVLLVASEATLARARVSAVVRSGLDGGPVPRVQPTLVIELDGQVIDTEQRALSTEAGAFEIQGLAPGYRYRMRLRADGLGAVELPWFEASARGTHFDVTLPMLAGLEVDARRGGRPAEGARVVVQRLVEDFDVDRPRSTDADDLGRARFERLLPGRQRLTLTLGAARHEQEFALEPGQTLRLVAELR